MHHTLSESNRSVRIFDLFNNHDRNYLQIAFAVEDKTWVLFDSLLSNEENKVWIKPGYSRPRVIRQKLTVNGFTGPYS